jgi:uncharacterized repeat protein (TIGR01451 family)
MKMGILAKISGVFVSASLVLGTLAGPALVSADAPANQRDCNDNAVINCGVADVNDLKAEYRKNQGDDVKAIYAHFHIPNEAALNGMVRGRVTKTNEVWVGNQKVADRAVTAGRHNMPGSTKIPGINAYMRNPAVSFRSNSLNALVKMKNGQFQYAVIMSCGNPVNAFPTQRLKPTPAPAPTPTPTPTPTPQPAPVFRCDTLKVEKTEEERTVSASVTATATNATFKNATFDWGDGNSTTAADTSNVPHTYAKAGTYTIKATVRVVVNGEERVTAVGAACTKTVTFEEQPQEKPVLQIKKDVRIKGQTAWQPDEVIAKPSDELEYRITVSNPSDTPLTNVVLHDTLPLTGILFNETDPVTVTGQQSVTIAQLRATAGLNLGTITKGQPKEVQFAVKVDDTNSICPTTDLLTNVASAKADNAAELQDNANAKVCKEATTPTTTTPTPSPTPAPTTPAVQAATTEEGKGLPNTGPVATLGIFSVTSALGFVAYKLKDFYLLMLR